MEAKLYGQNKGGMSINGIIKDYYAYAGENISAGDLVEYVNGIAGKTELGTSTDTQLSTASKSGNTISAVALDENRVFIAHSYGSSYYLYGIVVTIDGVSITYGTDTQLSTTNNTGNTISTVLLPNGNVFIAHGIGTTTTATNYLYGIVCTINGTTITKGTDTKLSDVSYTGCYIKSVLLPDGKVFIAHSYNSTLYLYGIVCTINGTTISAGTDTAISKSVSYTGKEMSICLLPNNNLFIAHSYNSAYYLYGIVVTVSGSTITTGTDTIINNSVESTGMFISTCLLPNGDVFIAHSHTENSYYLYGIVVTIDGTTITYGTDTELNSSTTHTGSCIKTQLLPSGAVLIIHSYSSSKYLAGMVAVIDGIVITKGPDTVLINNVSHTGGEISALLLDNGSIFVTHRYDSSNMLLYAQIFAIDYDNNIPTNNIVITEYETQVRKVTTGQFDGIAKTSGLGGDDTGHNDLVSIWTMPQYVEVTYTGNAFPTSWNVVTEGTNYSSDDGYVLEADSIYSSSFYVANACDGVSNNMWKSGQGTSHWVCMTLPTPIKITKMQAEIHATATAYFDNAIIQGSINGSEWVDLYSTSTIITPASEITLSNVDYYKHYRVLYTLKSSSEVSEDVLLQTAILDEWQTSEYTIKEEVV